MAGKKLTELDALPIYTETSLLPVHNGVGLKKGTIAQLVDYLSNKFSNPNLLINSDFVINTKAFKTYEKQGYSVDRWKIWNCTAIPNENGSITIKNDKYGATGTLVQYLDVATKGAATLSCYVESLTGSATMFSDDNSQVDLKVGLNVLHTSNTTKAFNLYIAEGATITIKWAKLEDGLVATRYIPPKYSDEYVRCQWYGRVITGARSGYVSNGVIYLNVPECQSMRLSAPTAVTSSMDLTGWIYVGLNASVLRVSKSDIINASVDNYKELVLTPSQTLVSKLKALGITTIDYVIENGGGIHLDAEIY